MKQTTRCASEPAPEVNTQNSKEGKKRKRKAVVYTGLAEGRFSRA